MAVGLRRVLLECSIAGVLLLPVGFLLRILIGIVEARLFLADLGRDELQVDALDGGTQLRQRFVQLGKRVTQQLMRGLRLHFDAGGQHSVAPGDFDLQRSEFRGMQTDDERPIELFALLDQRRQSIELMSGIEFSLPARRISERGR